MGLIMNYDNSLLTKYHHLNNTAIVFVTIKRVPFTYQLWERDETASFRYITRVHYKFPPHLLYSLFIMPIYALITASGYNDALINVRGHSLRTIALWDPWDASPPTLEIMGPRLTFDSFRQSLKTHLFGDQSA